MLEDWFMWLSTSQRHSTRSVGRGSCFGRDLWASNSDSLVGQWQSYLSRLKNWEVSYVRGKIQLSNWVITDKLSSNSSGWMRRASHGGEWSSLRRREGLVSRTLKKVIHVWSADESLWVLWMRNRYIGGRSLIEIEGRNNDSPVWREILRDRELFSTCATCEAKWVMWWTSEKWVEWGTKFIKWSYKYG